MTYAKSKADRTNEGAEDVAWQMGSLQHWADLLTTSANKLQNRQTLSTNYTEHTRLPYFDPEHVMHRWTPTYRGLWHQERTPSKVCLPPRQWCDRWPFHIPLSTVRQHQSETIANQMYATRYMDPLHNCSEQPTVVPVMNGHPRDQAKVSVHCRWPLIRGNLTLKCVGRGIDNVAVQGRWPLTTRVAQGRYYCTTICQPWTDVTRLSEVWGDQ